MILLLSCSSQIDSCVQIALPAAAEHLPNAQQLHIACIPVRALDGLGAAVDDCLALASWHHEVHQLVAVGGLQALRGAVLLLHSLHGSGTAGQAATACIACILGHE
jgi:hypothetical protein